MPIPTDDNFLTEWGVKLAGYFIAFVGGIVSTTWAVASRVKGFESRLANIETVQKSCPGKTINNIEEKLDRIHARIDEILLRDSK